MHGYKLLVFVIAAAYGGLAGGLLGVLQGYMPPDAFTFDTSGQLVMQTVIGGLGTLYGPLVGAAIWLYLRDFLQGALGLGATWKLVLGVVFVLLVFFLRRGVVGGLVALVDRATHRRPVDAEVETAADGSAVVPASSAAASATSMPPRHRDIDRTTGPILQARGLTKRYGGLLANSDIDFTVDHGELRGIIGPNGAGKSTFFKMLTCEVPPTSGTIVFEGNDITGRSVTDVCQLGLTKSYQVNQLFTHLTTRENVTIAALADLRGKFRIDLLRSSATVPGLAEQVEHTLALVDLVHRADTPVSALAYGEKRRLEIGLALATSPSLLLLDEPLAGMSPQERVATVKLLKSISVGRTMIIIDHDMDALFELAQKVTVLQEGRVLVEGTPDEIKGNPKVQEAYLGGVLDMSLLEVVRPEQLLRRLAHPVRRRAAGRGERGRRAARPQRRRQEHDAEEPDGRRPAALAARSCSTDSDLAGQKSHRIARAGMQLVHEDRRIFGSLNVEENLVLAGLTAPKRWPLERIYEMFPRLKERRGSRGTDLSGGEQQMLAIARALVRDPKLDPARRAVRGTRAGDRAGPDEGVPDARRGRADDRARRAEPRRDARARDARLHRQQRAHRARGIGARPEGRARDPAATPRGLTGRAARRDAAGAASSGQPGPATAPQRTISAFPACSAAAGPRRSRAP